MSVSEIIEFIISYINSNYTIRSDKKLKLTFDELKPDKDSIMFSLADDNTVVEKKTSLVSLLMEKSLYNVITVLWQTIMDLPI